MEKATIGIILRNRIKEKHLTQEKFAEAAGISLAALKKYLSGKTPYSYEMLIKFAEILDCSYDYLLGYSNSAVREYHEISKQIRLSDDAIRRLVEYSACYDTNYDAKRYIKTIDMMIQQNGLINCIADYFLSSSKYIQNTETLIEYTLIQATLKKLNIPNIVKENIYGNDLENIMLIHLISSLKDSKSLVNEEFLEELKKLAPIDQTREKFTKYLEELSDN